MSEYDPTTVKQPSDWAVTGFLFAATMMVLVGAFQAIAGLFAIFDGEFYQAPPHYWFDISVNTWGWIHLILGLVVAFGGLALFSGKAWAGILAIIVAMLSAVSNFLYIPYYPFWSIVLIALNVWVIWSLTRPGMIRA
jgi:hypothetical protein